MTAKQEDTAGLREELSEARAEVGRLQQELSSAIATRDQLVHISTQLNSTLKLQELLQGIMSAARDLLQAEACSIALIEEDTQELVIDVAVGAKSEDVQTQRVPSGKGIAGQVAQTGEPMVVNSAKDSPHFYGEIDRAVGFDTHNILALPLKVKDRIIGVVEIINKQGREGFGKRDLELAGALTSLAAVAIDNTGLYQKLADALVLSRRSYRL